MDTASPSVRLRAPATLEPACRLCGSRLHRSLIDLGAMPLADGQDDLLYPLHVRICDTCTLVQIAETAPPQAGATPAKRVPAVLTRTRHHAETMRRRLGLGANSLVIEVGSRDGTLLRPYQSAGIPVFAIAPNREIGIPTEIASFNTGTAMEIAVRQGCADLVIADNVLSYAPDPFDFAAGLACILRPNGMLTLQVPHLLSLLQTTQFDAFRHDTCNYLSLRVLEHVLRAVGLRVFDAERLPDQGGQLRILACHGVGSHAARPGLKAVRLAERFAELDRRDFYAGFSDRTTMARIEIRDFLRTRRAAGRRVSAFGATPRGITLLNCCGITDAEIASVADPDPTRAGHLLPGSRIPIVPLEALMEDPPDDIIVLPWLDAAEIVADLTPLRQHGTQIWTPLPRIARL